MSDFDFSLNSVNVNQLFVDYRKMDVLLARHRKGDYPMDDRHLNYLKVKFNHYRQIMILLDLMDVYWMWCHDLGMD